MGRTSCRSRRDLALALLCASVVGVPQADSLAQPRLAATPVYVEDSPAAEELVAEAHRLHSQGRAVQAAAKYQQVIDEYAGRLMPLEGQRYADAARWVRRALLADPKLLSAYRKGHESVAARLLSQAVAAGTDLQAMTGVFERFRLCRSGLEAGLLLAGAYLERGNGADAGLVLDELADHPDLASEAGRWHLLQAATGVFADQPSRLTKHTKALTDLGDTSAVAQATAWASQYRRTAVPKATSTDDRLPVESWPETPDIPLWQVTTLQGGPSHPQPGVSISQADALLRQRLSRTRTATQPPMTPVVGSDRLYLNDGVSIAAFDRSSGRGLWWHRSVDAALYAELLGSAARFAHVDDARSVAVDGDMLAAVVGRSAPLRRVAGGNVYKTSLICLTGSDGQVRWSVQPSDLDETLARAFFHGTPLVRNGRVFALLRRAQTSRFQGALVVAVDASSGKLLWRRHLSSAAPTNGGGQLLTQMLYHAGRLYLADYLGAVACLDSRTGAAIWLTVTRDLSKQPPGAAAARFRNVAMHNLSAGDKPVLTEAGLIVPAAGGGAAWLLDPKTGQKTRELVGPAWARESRILSLDGPYSAVLTLSDAVRLHDHKTLEPRWEHPLPSSATAKGRPLARPIVTLRHVAVTVGNALRLIDLATGKLVTQKPIRVRGNMLVLADQLIVAGPFTASAYISWDSASSRIRKRMETGDGDSADALALAYVGLLAKRPDALLEGVDAAIAMLPLDQRQTFGFIRSLIDPEAVGEVPEDRTREWVRQDSDMCRNLFDRLAAAADGEANVAAYRLALGRFLADGDKPADAVDQYQAILTDAGLTSRQVQLVSGSRQAGLEARTRLKSLVESHGADVYAEYEAMASARLAELAALGGAPASAWIDLAEQFPLASTTAAARVGAAEALARLGRVSQAIVQLNRAYVRTRDRELLQRIVGELVELHDQAGRAGRARQWLRRIRREQPGLRPLKAGTSVSIDRWIEELADRPGPDSRLPEIQLPLGKPYVLPGRLLTPTSQPREDWPRDAIVTCIGDVVQLRAGPQLEARWRTPLGDDDVTLLSLTDEQVLLWSNRSARLTALDVHTGQPIWQCGDVRTMVGRVAGGSAEAGRTLGVELAVQLAGMAVVAPRADRTAAPKLLVEANDMVVCVADVTGRAVALDRHNGNVLWQHHCGVAQLTHVAIDDDTVAIAGTTILPQRRRAGKVAVLDALTGALKRPQVEEKDAIGWLGFPDVGVLVYATASTVVAMDTADGDTLWRLPIDVTPLSGIGAAGDGHVLIHDNGGSLLLIDAASGRLAHRLELAGTARKRRGAAAWPVLQLRLDDQQWHLLTPLGAQAWQYDGRLLWRDAISAAKKAMLLQVVSDQFVGVAAQVELAGLGRGQVQHGYRLFVLDRRGGAIRAECDIPTGDQPLDSDARICLDHRLILSTAESTIVVPDSIGASP